MFKFNWIESYIQSKRKFLILFVHWLIYLFSFSVKLNKTAVNLKDSLNYLWNKAAFLKWMMEAKVFHKLQCPTWIDLEKFPRKSSGSVRFSRRMREEKRLRVLISAQMEPNIASNQRSYDSVKVSCTFNSFSGSYHCISTIYVLNMLIFWLFGGSCFVNWTKKKGKY